MKKYLAYTGPILGPFSFVCNPRTGKPMIQISDSAKTAGDVTAGSTAFLTYFHSFPWSELAAAASFIYIALRIVELVVGWLRRR